MIPSRHRATLLALLLLFLLTPAARSHPVPEKNHDRTILVRLTHDAKNGTIVVHVEYGLELDELTAANDLAEFRDQLNYNQYEDRQTALYGEFTRIYAPILGGNLAAKADGKELTFQCVKRSHSLRDKDNRPLGHLRCDFDFQATFPARSGQEQTFACRECNYELQSGKIDVSLVAESPLRIAAKTEADEALKKRSEAALRPGDEEKLRRVSATITLPSDLSARETMNPADEPREVAVRETMNPAAAPATAARPNLFRLFLESDYGIMALLLFSAGIGAVHALTPGHGKTLVAAYLVGERGTVMHALVLGLVTTLTHTGVVLVCALSLFFVPQDWIEFAQRGVEIGLGLLIACLGFWLLLRRLSGRADHFHVGGHGHHHHHGHADHDHDAHGNVIPRTSAQPVGWWGLIALGMSGGIVPCWDAIVMLFVAVSMNLLWLALPMLLAFSAGLAGVLVLIGILVVYAKNFAQSRLGEGRLTRALPVVSAAVIAVLGFWLCYEGVHADTPSQPASAHARP